MAVPLRRAITWTARLTESWNGSSWMAQIFQTGAARPCTPWAMSLRGEAEQPFADAHRVELAVRHDDIDTNGHVRGPPDLAYGEHAWWIAVAAAGIDLDELRALNIGPVNLETTPRFGHELGPHDQVEVRTVFGRSTGKTSRVVQQLRRSDRVLAAEVTSVSGMLNLLRRCLTPDQDRYWRSPAVHPEVLGLTWRWCGSCGARGERVHARHE